MRGHFESIYSNVMKKIQLGQLELGEKLPSLEKLSDEYKVGISTVREAMRALQSQSFIKIEQGRGTFVIYDPKNDSSITREEIRKHLELSRYRIMIEPSFTATAAIQAFQSEIDVLVTSANRMADLAKKGEDTKEEDLFFHLTVARATHNPFVIKFYENLQTELKNGRQLTNVPGMIEKASNYHLLIAEAIRTRNSGQAKMYMEAHMQSNEELALETLFSSFD